MPALIVGRRRWHLAADDFPLPSAFGAAWHGALLAIAALDLASVQRLDGCGYRIRHTACLSALVACLATICLLHVWTFVESQRGAFLETDRRWRVPWLVLSTGVLHILTIGVNAYGTSLLERLHREPACGPSPSALHLSHSALFAFVIVATWASLFAVLVLGMVLNFQPVRTSTGGLLVRLLCCCCCCYVDGEGPLRRWRRGSGARDGEGGGRGVLHSSPMRAIAEIITYIFGGVDMTFSDYLAALALVGVRHHHAKPALTYANAPPPDWLSGSDGGGGRGGGGDGELCGMGGTSGAVLRPPPVLEITASVRPPNGAAADAAQDMPSGAPASLPATKPTASQLDDAPRASGAAQPASLPTTSTPSSYEPSGPDTQPGPLHHLRCGSGAAAPRKPARGSCHLAPGGAVTAPNGNASCPADWQNRELHSHAVTESDAKREWDGTYAAPNVDEKVVEEALHYMRFATAVYGWKMYLWMNRQQVTRCCRLCWGRGCGCCRQSAYFLPSGRPDAPSAEGCCSPAKLLEREAIAQLTCVPDADILHVCYANRVGGLLPYYLALDRERAALVLAVRGSLSLQDALTDLLCERAEMGARELGVGEAEAAGAVKARAAGEAGQPDAAGPVAPNPAPDGRGALWAHRGMLGSARAIAADLRRHGLLEAVLRPWPADEAGSERALRHLPERARHVARRLRGACAGWRLVVTGHSLGGGVTGLLGPMLRAEFPSLRCWAFAPPAGLMSPQAAALTRGYCVSVVHAKDMIPRLGIGAMERLVQELVHAAAHCAVSKAAVLGGALRPAVRARLRREGLFLPSERLSEPQRRALAAFKASLEACQLDSRFTDARNFVPPGHILYLERRKQPQRQQHGQQPGEKARAPQLTGGRMRCAPCGACCSDGGAAVAGGAASVRYGCRWIRVEDLVGRGLVVSRSMFLDHVPDATLKALEQALAHTREERGRGGAPSSAGGHCAKRSAPVAPAVAPLLAAVAAPTEPDGGSPHGANVTRAREVVLTVMPEGATEPPRSAADAAQGDSIAD